MRQDSISVENVTPQWQEITSDGLGSSIVYGNENPSRQLKTVMQHLARVSAVLGEAVISVPENMEPLRAVSRLYTTLLDASQIEIRTRKTEISGRPALWIWPPGADPSRRMLYLHGGAYAVGRIEDFQPLLAWFAEVVECAILIIDYRLAPEHPFPAALEDALSAYNFIGEHGPEERGGARRCFIAGDSAGGGLSLALACYLRDKGMQPPDALVCIAPWTDVSLTKSDVLLEPAAKAVAQKYADMYVGEDRADNPLISPIYSEAAGLPPMLIQVGDADVSGYPDSVAYVEKVRSAGGEVRFEVWRHMPHVWHAFVPYLPEARQAIEAMAYYLKRWP